MQFQKLNASSQSSLLSKIDILCYADVYKKEIVETFVETEYSLNFVNDLMELQEAIQQLSINQLNTTLLLEINAGNQIGAEEIVAQLKKNWLTRNLLVIF